MLDKLISSALCNYYSFTDCTFGSAEFMELIEECGGAVVKHELMEREQDRQTDREGGREGGSWMQNKAIR